VPAQHLELTSSVDVSAPNGSVRTAIDRARNMDNVRNDEDVDHLASAVTATLVQPPAVGFQVSGAYGISKRVEIGLRSSLGAFCGWARYQFLRARPGIYGAIGLGASAYLYGPPIQFTNLVEMHDFDRYDLDIPLSIGYSSKVFHVWGGPKLVFTDYVADVSVCLDRSGGACVSEVQSHIDGTAAYVAGQLGIAVGYERFWVAAELTVARLGLDATIDLSSAGTTRQTRFEGESLVLAPAFGLIVWL